MAHNGVRFVQRANTARRFVGPKSTPVAEALRGTAALAQVTVALGNRTLQAKLRAEPTALLRVPRRHQGAQLSDGPTPHYSRLLLLQARLPRASRLSSSLLAAAHR
jgi:hypothetical protein